MQKNTPTKRKIQDSLNPEKLIKKEHFPKFTIKPGSQHRSLTDICNLML